MPVPAGHCQHVDVCVGASTGHANLAPGQDPAGVAVAEGLGNHRAVPLDRPHLRVCGSVEEIGLEDEHITYGRRLAALVDVDNVTAVDFSMSTSRAFLLEP